MAVTTQEKAEQLANALIAAGASRSLVEAFSAAILIAAMEEVMKGLGREIEAIDSVIEDMRSVLQSNHWGTGT